MRRRRRQPAVSPAVAKAQLTVAGLTDEQAYAVNELVLAHARAEARAAVASLAGFVLERVQESGVDKKDPAHRTSGALDLSDTLASAFAAALEHYSEEA